MKKPSIINTNNPTYRAREMMKKSIDALKIRHDVIANNVANVDTPGFKRSVVTFEAQLKRALDSERYESLEAKVTNIKHIPFKTPIEWEKVNPKLVLDYATTLRNDGNNVDIDRESTELAKTAMAYNANMELLKHNYNLINLVLK